MTIRVALPNMTKFYGHLLATHMDITVMIIKVEEKYLVVQAEERDRSGRILTQLYNDLCGALDASLLPMRRSGPDILMNFGYGAGVRAEDLAHLAGSIMTCRVRVSGPRDPTFLQPKLRLALQQMPWSNI